jgi:hypothetical protein
LAEDRREVAIVKAEVEEEEGAALVLVLALAERLEFESRLAKIIFGALVGIGIGFPSWPVVGVTGGRAASSHTEGMSSPDLKTRNM